MQRWPDSASSSPLEFLQARYCSEKCSEEDWTNHQDFCRRRHKKRKEKRRKEKSRKKKSEKDDNEEEVGGEEPGAFEIDKEEEKEEEEEERCMDKMRELNLG